MCALTRVPAPGKGFKEETKKWSVWQRYSAFVTLDASLREKYGWQMNHIKLPPKKTFGNKNPDFVERRRMELQVYIQAVLKVKNITEFDKHFGSQELAEFFKYHEHATAGNGVAGGAGGDDAAEGWGDDAEPAAAPAARAPVRRAAKKRAGGARRRPRPSAAGSRGGAPRAPAAAAASTAAPRAAAAAAPPSGPPPSGPPPSGAPPSAPPPRGIPPAAAGRGGLMAAIRGGTTLRKAETNDRSTPKV